MAALKTRLRSVMAWALGATSLAGADAAFAPAHAVLACSSTFTGTGGSTLSQATQIPGSCLASITGNQGFDAYWEFSFNSAVQRNVSSSVNAGFVVSSLDGSFYGGSFYGSLDLYKDNGAGSFTLLNSASFAPTDITGQTSSASLGTVSLDANQNYIIGIEGSPLDPPFSIAFDDPAASAVPEPTSLSLMGAAAMAMSFVRTRRRRR